jgi:hypothetical protein
MSFREKYQSFWELLAEKLFLLSSTSSVSGKTKTGGKRGDKEENAGIELMKLILDQLYPLARLSLINLRDAAAEAALSFAHGLFPLLKEIKDLKDTAARQVNGGGILSQQLSSLNPKTKAFTEQIERYNLVRIRIP